MPVIAVSVIAVAALSTAGSAASTQPPVVISWTDLKNAIGETICVETIQQGGQEYAAGNWGDLARCKHGQPDTPLRRAIAAAFDQARSVLTSVAPDVEDIARQHKDAEARNIAFSEKCFAKPEFMRALVPRLVKALSAENLACDGCPAFAPLPVRRVSWDVFGPYVGAYVYPDPVRTPTDASGKPSGRPRYSFHICVGLNGIAEMQDPDAALARAAFVAMFGDKTIRGKAGEYFQDILSDSNFERLASDADRTAYLRKHLSAKIASDSVVRATVCERLRMFVTDLAIDVFDCPAPATDKPKPP